MLEPDENKRLYKEEIKNSPNAENIVYSISREKVGDNWEYHAYNIFGEEIIDYFQVEKVKTLPEREELLLTFSMPFSSQDCKECEERNK